MSYNAIRYGRKRGICRSWDDSEFCVHGYTWPPYKQLLIPGTAGYLMGQGTSPHLYRQNRRAPYASASRYLRYRGYCPRSRSAPASEKDSGEHTISTDSPYYKMGYPGLFFSDDPENSAKPAVRLMNNYEGSQALTEAEIMTSDMGFSRLQITDSGYRMNCKENRMKKCKRNNLRGDSDKAGVNQLLKELREMERAFNRLDVKLEYVPGNTGVHCKEQTPKLPCDGASKSSHQEMPQRSDRFYKF